MAVEDEAVLRLRTKSVSWREVDGEIIALDLDSSTYFTTNSTGTVLWNVLNDGATIDQLVEALQSHFDIDDDTAERDVRAFLSLLETNGLVESE